METSLLCSLAGTCPQLCPDTQMSILRGPPVPYSSSPVASRKDTSIFKTPFKAFSWLFGTQHLLCVSEHRGSWLPTGRSPKLINCFEEMGRAYPAHHTHNRIGSRKHSDLSWAEVCPAQMVTFITCQGEGGQVEGPAIIYFSQLNSTRILFSMFDMDSVLVSP